MPVPVLQGTRLRLRPAVAPDREERRALGRVPEVAAGFGIKLSEPAEMTQTAAAAWFAALVAGDLAWVIDLGGHFAGTLRLDSLDAADGRASLAVAIFDPSLLGQGLGPEAIQLASRYAFEELGLHRLSLRVLASNARAIRCYEKCGFRVEGRERESARVGDTWEDDLIMGLLRQDWLAFDATG